MGHYIIYIKLIGRRALCMRALDDFNLKEGIPQRRNGGKRKNYYRAVFS